MIAIQDWITSRVQQIDVVFGEGYCRNNPIVVAALIESHGRACSQPTPWWEDDESVETVRDVAASLSRIASAITTQDAGIGQDATGVGVSSLTEAMMGVTKALALLRDGSR